LAATLLVASVFGVYWECLGHEFVAYDDPEIIYENPWVLGGLTWEGVQRAFTHAHVAFWHPMTTISLLLSQELFGLDAGKFILVNIVLHALNAVLLLTALRAMSAAFWPSAIAAFLFALHPLRVESVAWATERKDVLSGLFLMLTLLAYAHYVRAPSLRRYLLVGVAFALGLMSKPILVTVPVLLLLLDIWPLQRWRPGEPGKAVPSRSPPVGLRRLILEKVPLVGLSAATVLATLVAQPSTLDDRAFELLGADQRIANALLSTVAYLRTMAWPSELSFFYPHPAVIAPDALSLASPGCLGACALLVVVSLASLRFLRRAPYLAVGWFWFLIALLPVIGFLQSGGQARADRFTYVPMIGICLATTWGVAALIDRWPRARKPTMIVTALILVACPLASLREVRHWRNTYTLFERALEVTENNYIAHNGLGTEYLRAGELDLAEQHIRAALSIRPDLHVAHNNLGLAYARRGKPGAAVEHFENAIRLMRGYAEAHNNLGVALQATGDLQGAVEHYRRSLEIGPPMVNAANNLAWLLAATSNGDLRAPEEAVHWAVFACRATNHRNPRYLETLAAAHAAQGNFTAAVRWQSMALELLPPGPRREQRARLSLYKQNRPFRMGS